MTPFRIFLVLLTLGAFINTALSQSASSSQKVRYTWLLEDKEMNLQFLQKRFSKAGQEQLRLAEAEHQEKIKPIIARPKSEAEALQLAESEHDPKILQMYEAYSETIRREAEPFTKELEIRLHEIRNDARYNSVITLTPEQRAEFDAAWAEMVKRRDLLYALPGERPSEDFDSTKYDQTTNEKFNEQFQV